MFAIAFLIGLYANIIFLLGVANISTKPIIIFTTGLYLFLSVIFWEKFDEKIEIPVIGRELKLVWQAYRLWCLFVIIALGIIILGVLAPELSFDALWYHLTLPKVFLSEGSIHFIPGGLLYYSTMPKLGELLYLGALSLSNEILAKAFHATFALLAGIAIYAVTLRYAQRKYALLAVVMFFSNIVVLWEATTAYIDLIRTFFEIMAAWGFLEFLSTKKRKWLIEAALLLGLAIETKLVAMGSLAIFVILILTLSKNVFSEKVKDTGTFILFAILPSLGWLALSYLSTDNPFYPLFSNYAIHIGQDTLAFPAVLLDPILVFIRSSDPISPIYLILFPLFFIVKKKLPKNTVPIFLICFLSLIVWTVTPKTGGGRFLLPYLPIFSVAGGVIISQIRDKTLQKISVFAICGCMTIAIIYRGIATLKFIPVIVGLESKNSFLTRNLNFGYGDFVDTDGEFARSVQPGSKVLLYGFHNLYYMNVPFVDSSWVRPGDRFNYVATQNTQLPARFRYWQPVYTNKTTGVTLYTVGTPWVY